MTLTERPVISIPVKRANGTPLLDRNGRETIARARHGYDGYGTKPGSVTSHTLQGTKFLRATWLPTGNQAEFTTLRDATAFLYAHHDIQSGKLS